jgi:hypothetical protein
MKRLTLTLLLLAAMCGVACAQETREAKPRDMVEALPAITREAYDDGTRRGREVGMRAMTRILAEGILTPPTSILEQPPAPKPKPKTRSRGRRG